MKYHLFLILSIASLNIQAQFVTTYSKKPATNVEYVDMVEIDSEGNKYYFSQLGLRKVDKNDSVIFSVGSKSIGFTNGTGDDASFNGMAGVAVSKTGNIYVAEANNGSIRKINPQGVVSTLAGNGVRGSSYGTGANASFMVPEGIVVDSMENVYVADEGKIKKITPEGVVSPFVSIHAQGLAIDKKGNMYAAGYGIHAIYKITPNGLITHIAGKPDESGFVDGPANSARFNSPNRIEIDPFGNLYVGDYWNNAVRKITPEGVVSTIAGGKYGYVDGIAKDAQFTYIQHIGIDPLGDLYVTDIFNLVIRKITMNNVITGITNSNNLTSEISVFPNPVSNILYFNSTVDIKAVRIEECTGKNVLSSQLKGNALNIEELEKGIYILSMETERGNKKIKFIKE
jgi:mucin-19